MSTFEDCKICGINYNADTFNDDNPHKCLGLDMVRRIEQLQSDVVVLGLRLLGEDEASFSPEAAETMTRLNDQLIQQLG